MPFDKCLARLSIASLDEDLTVTAQYNPHELAVKKTLPWSPKLEQQNPKAATRSEQDSHEYKGTPARSMSLELLFDCYEVENGSVEPIVETLEKLSTVRDPESTVPDMRRPHFCVVVFGDGIKPLRCIITSLNVRYTMFGRDGTPLRAICNLEVEEARLASSYGAVKKAGFDAVKAMGRAALEAFRVVR